MVANTQIFKTDTVEEWLRKTNVLITDTVDYSLLIGKNRNFDEQFKISDNDGSVANFSAGVVRRKKEIYRIEETQLSLDSLVCVVYIDLLSLDSNPIKSVSILDDSESSVGYDEVTATFDGQTVFSMGITPAINSIVWLDGVELTFGISNDYLISGNNIVINNPAIVSSGNKLFVANVDTTDYDSLEDILPLYRIGGTNATDLRTWAFVKKNELDPYPDVPMEFFFELEQPQDIFNLDGASAIGTTVYVDGLKVRENTDYVVFSPNEIKFNSPLPIGTKVIVFAHISSEFVLQVTLEEDVFATVNGQTDFVFIDIPVNKKMAIWVSGVRQPPSSFSVNTATNTITLSAPLLAGELVHGAVNLPSDGKPFFFGGTVGQIPTKNSNADFDWSWADPEFDADAFNDSQSMFLPSTIPFEWDSFSDNTQNRIYSPKSFKGRNSVSEFNTWSQNQAIPNEDLLVVGHSKNSSNNLNNYVEFLVAQRCGRISKVRRQSIITTNPIENAPFELNAIDVWREPVGYTLFSNTKVAGILVGGTQGRLAYSLNSINVPSEAQFGNWVELGNVFESGFEIVDICTVAVPTSNTTTTIPFEQYVFVSAYSKINNRSIVRWKKAEDIADAGKVWNFYQYYDISGPTLTTYFTGKITKFAHLAKVWAASSSLNPASMATMKFAIGNSVFTFDDNIPDRTTVNGVNGSILKQTIGSETIIDIYGVTTKSKSTATTEEDRMWFAIADSGAIYRQMTTKSTALPPPNFTACSVFPYGKPLKMGAIGVVKNNGDTSNTFLKHLVFFDGGVAEFEYQADAANIKYKLSEDIKIKGHPQFVSRFASIEPLGLLTFPNGYMLNNILFIQDAEASISKINSIHNSSSYVQEKLNQLNESRFCIENSIVPPLSAQNIISDGNTVVYVANKPYNCMWVMKNKMSYGDVIPVAGDVIGAFYELGRFIVVTTKFIYSSTDAVSWVKTVYTCPTNRSGLADMTGSTISGQSIWVMANGVYSAYSLDGINWTTLTGAIIPNNSISSDGSNQFAAVDANGYLIFSSNGIDWVKADELTMVTAFDARSGWQIPDVPLQYDGIDINLKYVSVQYTTDGGFICSRDGIGNILSYKNPLDIISYVPTSFKFGSGEPLQTFRNGNVATSLYGKDIIFTKTARGEIHCTSGSTRGAIWFKLSIPVHSKDSPTGVSYDKNGNYFLGTMAIGNKTRDSLPFNRMVF